MSAQVFKPDQQYFEAIAAKLLRLSGRSPDEVQEVLINCGSSPRGWVVLKTGEKIEV